VGNDLLRLTLGAASKNNQFSHILIDDNGAPLSASAPLPQSSSASRRTAGAAGFLNLSLYALDIFTPSRI
jgi:hypothetical protein